MLECKYLFDFDSKKIVSDYKYMINIDISKDKKVTYILSRVKNEEMEILIAIDSCINSYKKEVDLLAKIFNATILDF